MTKSGEEMKSQGRTAQIVLEELLEGLIADLAESQNGAKQAAIDLDTFTARSKEFEVRIADAQAALATVAKKG